MLSPPHLWNLDLHTLKIWKFEQSPLIKDLITTTGCHQKTRKRKEKKKKTKTNFSELLSDDLFSQGLVGGSIWQPAEVMQSKALLHWLCWAHWQTWLHSKFISYILAYVEPQVVMNVERNSLPISPCGLPVRAFLFMLCVCIIQEDHKFPSDLPPPSCAQTTDALLFPNCMFGGNAWPQGQAAL